MISGRALILSLKLPSRQLNEVREKPEEWRPSFDLFSTLPLSARYEVFLTQIDHMFDQHYLSLLLEGHQIVSRG